MVLQYFSWEQLYSDVTYPIRGKRYSPEGGNRLWFVAGRHSVPGQLRISLTIRTESLQKKSGEQLQKRTLSQAN
jgi:hypothetical protein